jgi:hypothetical protein
MDLYKGTGEEQLAFVFMRYLLFEYGQRRKMGTDEALC